MQSKTFAILLMTTALVTTLGVSANAQQVTLTTSGPIGTTSPAATPATPAAGITPTNGTNASTDTAVYNGANINATANQNIAGQNGGNGGNDTNGGTAGIAGNGGIAVNLNGQTAPTLNVDNAVTITGGSGGQGGTGQTAGDTNGAAGGFGGVAVNASSTTTVINITGTGSIIGGAGGAGGADFGNNRSGGNGRAGGAAVASSGDLTINFTGSGSVIAGLGGAAGVKTGGGFGNNGAAGITKAAIVMNGGNLTITGADGVIRSDGTNSQNAVNLEGAFGTFTNAATIGSSTRNTFEGAVGVEDNGTTSLITNTGTFQGGIGRALMVGSGGVLTQLNNTGTIVTNNSEAISLTGAIGSLVNSGTGGIRATGNAGVALKVRFSGDIGSINNTGGVITSANTSTDLEGTFIVENDLGGLNITGGTISNTSTTNGNAINIRSDQSGAIVSSANVTAAGSGGSASAVRFDDATVVFSNSGVITGNINAGNINTALDIKEQTVNNTAGSITGNINLADGNDTVNLTGGAVNGNIDLGDGSNTFIYGNAASATGFTGTLALGVGSHTLTINENFTTGGAITTAAGNTTAATVATGKTFKVDHNVDLADGTFTNDGITHIDSGLAIFADVDAGAGKYVFEVSTATTTTGAGAVNGLLDLSGGTAESVIDSVADIEIALGSSVDLVKYAQIRLVSGGAPETFDFAGQMATENSIFFNFMLYNGDDAEVTFAGATANDIIAKVERVGATLVGTNISTTIDPILASIGQAGDASFDAIQNNLTGATSADTIGRIYNTLSPEINNAT
jgi:fibronectin-binding autotransporter adhesin